MADVNDLLSQYLTPTGPVPSTVMTPVPVQPVTASPEDAAAVANAAANGDASVLLNLAGQRDNTLATQNQIVNDFNNPDISYFDYLQKYGANTTADMGQVSLGNQELLRLTENERRGTDRLTDNASSVATGLVGGIGDAATFVAGAFNRDAGRFTSETVDTFRSWMGENTQSTQSKQNKFVAGLRSELDSMDNNQLYERSLKDGKKSSFMAGLEYLGRGIVNGASRFVEDPQSLETGLSEGVGSLFAGGYVGKGLGIAGKLAGLGKLATSAAVPAAIGMMEGGSAYTGALQEVRGMSVPDLLEKSPTFRNLVAGGMDVDKARDQVAAQAAEIAAAIQAPVGVLTGKLVAKFEAHPLGSKGFSDMVGNILRETVEEGTQSATGQLAQNLGVQQADQTKSLLEDVGDQTAQGAILGGLTAGAVQTPSIPRAAISTALKSLTERAQSIQKANDEGSGVTDEQVAAAATTVAETMAPVADAAEKLAQAVPEDIRSATDAINFKTRIENAITVKPEDISSLGDNTLKYFADKGVPVPQDRINLLAHTARAVMDETSPMDVKQAGALFLASEIDNQSKLFNEDIEEAKSGLDQESDEYKAISNYQQVLAQISANPTMKSAMQWAKANASVDVAEGQQADEQTVKNAIKATTAMPSAITPNAARTIMKQANDGSITVTPEQKKALQQTTDAIQIAQQAEATIAKADAEADYTPAVKDVADQIMRRGGTAEYQLSIDQHIGRINKAIIEGNPTAAEAALRHMGNFGWSQRNKAVAALRSLTSGSEVSFPRLGAYGKRNPVDGKIQIHANSPGSLALARRVFVEANALIDQTNALIASNPDLGIENTLERLPLPSELFKTPQPATAAAQQSEPEVKGTEAPSVTETPLTDDLGQEQQSAPQPEVTAPTTVADVVEKATQIEKSEIEKKFPFMVSAKKFGNRLINAFRGTTRFGAMLEKGEPLAEFVDALNSGRTAREFVGSDPTFTITPDQIGALQEYLELGMSMINEGEFSLVGRAAKVGREIYSKGKPENFRDKLVAGEDIGGTVRGKAFALLQKTDRGYHYNPALVQTAMMAALHWFSGSQNRDSFMDRQDIAQMAGIDASEITPAQVQAFASGVGLTQAVRGLAQDIQTFWGMDINKDVAVNQIVGISEGIAKEILNVMLDRGLMTSEDIKLSNDQTYTQFYFGENINKSTRRLLAEMGPAKKLIELAAVREEDRSGATYNAPPERVAPTQMRNKAVQNSRFQKRVIAKAQNIAHNFYANSHDMLNAIGKKGLIELAGSIEITEDTPFNEQHLKSVKGRNLTITMALDAANEQVEELKAFGTKNGINDPENIKKYYQFNYSRVNRLQMLGVMNPQSSKLMRHVFLPTKRTVNLTDPNSEASLGFFMAINQGLGAKTQHFTNAENAAQGRALVETGPLSPLVQELGAWLKAGKKGSLYEWSQKVRQVDPKITEHGIMSLLSAAEYFNVSDLSEFVTHNYFEADGVTNGPANALMNLTTEVSEDWVNTVAKTGALLGSDTKSMVNQKDEDDLYKTGANRLGKLQRDFANKLPDSVKPVHQSLMNMMRALGMDILITKEGIEIKRGVLKNPLTITIYGSGIDGIAGNVASQLVDSLYEAMSEHLQQGKNMPFGEGMIIDGLGYNAQQFWADYDNLIGNLVVNNDNVLSVVKPKFAPTETGVPNNEELRTFEVKANEFRTLRDNVRALFVDNMSKAIDDTVMAHVKGMVDNIQQSTNAQSIVLHYMFRKELMKAMAARKQNPEAFDYKQGDFLTQNELDGILKRLLPFGAVISTENQTYFMGGGERTDVMKSRDIILQSGEKITVNMPEAFSRSLTDDMKTPAYTYGPSIAGVAGVPSFNIGTGDGRMIDVFLNSMRGFGVLPVFDGINLPVDKILEGSRLANEAVMATWTENPAQYAAESFKAFLRQNPLERMLDPSDPFNVERDEMIRDLTKNALGVRDPSDMLTMVELQGVMEALNTKLEVGAQLIGDRQAAMKNFPLSVDQMAGGNNPYQQTGKVKLPDNATPAQIAQALQFEMDRVRAARTKGEVVSGPVKEFVAAFRQKASVDTDSGALVAGIEVLDSIRRTLNNKLSNNLREMLNASLTSLVDSDYQVVFGTPAMVDKFEQNHFPNGYMGDGSSYFGKIDVENRTIYITNPSAETLAHELVHAATITKMQAYYADKSSVSVSDGEAIARLEGLMNEWLAASYEREGPVVGEAHRLAVSAVMEFKNQDRTPEAVNEFIAWALTNQNIASVMKKTAVNNPVYRVIGQALTALKKLIWGNKKAPSVGTDMFSNVKFNARVLMATPTPMELFERDFGNTVMFQSSSFGSSDRLSDVRKRFGEQMVQFVRQPGLNDRIANAAGYVSRRQDALEALLRHADIANRIAVPFHMNMQQISTFKMIGATLSVAEHLNSASMVRMGEVFDAVIQKISPADFLLNRGDPQADEYQAQEKYKALTGDGFGTKDKKGRASLIPNFIALSVVDEQMREVLRKLDMPVKIMDKSWNLDALVDRASNAGAASLATYATGQGRENVNMQAAMDALTQNLIENIGDQRTFTEQRVDNGLDKADTIIKTYIEKGAKKVIDWSNTLSTPLGIKARKYLQMTAKMMTEEGTKSLARTTVSFFNQPGVWDAQREVINEIIGRTEENAPVFDMITRVRTFVDQTRQRWREEFPKELKSRFKDKLTEEQWSDLHHGLGRTDAASLWATYRGRTMDLLSSGSERASEIRDLEGRLSTEVKAKAKQLATYMVTGDHGPQLQPNAYAIAVINGVLGSERDIDNLVTLYAIEQSPQEVKDTLDNVVNNQSEGLNKIFHSLVATYNDERAKATTEEARMNGFKGHLPGQNQEGVHMVIDDRQNHGQYMAMGYVDMGDYVGSSSDIGTEKRGYYFAPVSGRAKFNQGVMQTVQQSYFGVNPETGFSVGALTAGRVTDQRAVAAITRRIANQRSTKENLKPVYNGQGRIIAYERMADPLKLSQLNPSFDLADAMGAWRGRQSEEMASKAVNEELVDKTFRIYNDGRMEGRSNEFVRVDRSTDPIVADAWSVIPRETKEYIKSKFGVDGFMVRKDMLNDVIGARSATVGDFWTGNSRWSPAVQKEIRDALVGFLGNKGYTRLVNLENFIQSSVTDAKVLIVVKSLIVPAANLISNVYQLSMNGVPIRHIFTGFKQKTFELNSYIKMKEQERQVQNDLFAAEGANNSVEIRKLSTRLQVLQDSYKSMLIYPLIEAGEFGAITDGGLSQEDLAIAKGGYGLMVDKLVNKLPDNGIRDAGRYGMITRDTALFKLMSRATQYGDFLGKATLYDDLTQRRKMSSKDALAFINEEFVNYNRFSGRNRAYGEAMGMFWFHNFKIRSMKIAQRMLHNHPVRALLHTALQPRIPLLGSVGNAMTDNMLSVIMNGRLGYSVGPGQLLRAPQLNPWYNILD